ncbi:MAG TPA: hypothetical protein VM510_13340 [Caulifigura sp.]|nr:hypothetical protein [Caulifigura sp.]
MRSSRLPILLAFLLLTGCGGSGLKLYPVKGKVSYNGKPLTTGSVMFTPKAKGPAAYGAIGADGTYKLMTGEEEGAVAGPHTVMISAMKDNGVNSPMSYLIPAKYGSESSGLEADVKDQGENTFDFAITGKEISEKPVPVMP